MGGQSIRAGSHLPQKPAWGSSSSPIPAEVCQAPQVLASESHPWPSALRAAHAWSWEGVSLQSPRLGGQRSHSGQGGRQAREEGVGSGAGGREGGRIDSLSSTGTTELSCHGERGAAGRAQGGWRSHMPEGRRQPRANPTVLLLQPPPSRPLGPGRQG
jgi:hypothetical protein